MCSRTKSDKWLIRLWARTSPNLLSLWLGLVLVCELRFTLLGELNLGAGEALGPLPVCDKVLQLFSKIHDCHRIT